MNISNSLSQVMLRYKLFINLASSDCNTKLICKYIQIIYGMQSVPKLKFLPEYIFRALRRALLQRGRLR